MQIIKHIFMSVAEVIDISVDLVIIAVLLRAVTDAFWPGSPFNNRLQALTDPLYAATDRIAKHKIKEPILVPLIIILSLVFLRTVIVGCLQDILH